MSEKHKTQKEYGRINLGILSPVGTEPEASLAEEHTVLTLEVLRRRDRLLGFKKIRFVEESSLELLIDGR